MEPKHYDGEIFQTNKYRTAPRVYPKEIDEAWGVIGGGVGVLRLYENEVNQLRIKEDDPFRPLHQVPDEEGGYAGVLEVFHLLHCLVSCSFERDRENLRELGETSRKSILQLGSL